jgi:hypothetical protein
MWGNDCDEPDAWVMLERSVFTLLKIELVEVNMALSPLPQPLTDFAV